MRVEREHGDFRTLGVEIATQYGVVAAYRVGYGVPGYCCRYAADWKVGGDECHAQIIVEEDHERFGAVAHTVGEILGVAREPEFVALYGSLADRCRHKSLYAAVEHCLNGFFQGCDSRKTGFFRRETGRQGSVLQSYVDKIDYSFCGFGSISDYMGKVNCFIAFSKSEGTPNTTGVKSSGIFSSASALTMIS